MCLTQNSQVGLWQRNENDVVTCHSDANITFALAMCVFVNFHFVHFDFHIGHTTLSSNLKKMENSSFTLLPHTP